MGFFLFCPSPCPWKMEKKKKHFFFVLFKLDIDLSNRAYRQPLDVVHLATTSPVYLATSAVMYSRSCQIWSNASRHNLEIQLVRQIENPLNLHHNFVSTISPSQSDHRPPHSRHLLNFSTLSQQPVQTGTGIYGCGLNIWDVIFHF